MMGMRDRERRELAYKKGFKAGKLAAATPSIDEDWIAGFAEWNLRTFGPGMRTAGTLDHIRKECREIEANPNDPKEWVDIILLGINGLVRQGHTPAQIIAEIHGKHEVNEARIWPDWRTTDPARAIEHDRSSECGNEAL
ncbi:dATP/dGTP pyrophosphohydrolase domain-containing protein [Rhizobium sp. RM]|uniref:dATP/dGTP pyrophosphohydrolase domain-containing protein n=1 Tax=Rhizobium sp. RM TaxID=2748079 RepID=UPI001FEE1297|nr:dATP/dGTP pyrophosphohydrolase domain-containing protein [Rhizobium sp. RM]